MQLFATNSHGGGTIPLLFPGSSPAHKNISTRLAVGTDADVCSSAGSLLAEMPQSECLSVQLGPPLVDFGVTGALQDPTLELHDRRRDCAQYNDNWRDFQSRKSSIPVLNR